MDNKDNENLDKLLQELREKREIAMHKDAEQQSPDSVQDGFELSQNFFIGSDMPKNTEEFDETQRDDANDASKNSPLPVKHKRRKKFAFTKKAIIILSASGVLAASLIVCLVVFLSGRGVPPATTVDINVKDEYVTSLNVNESEYAKTLLKKTDDAGDKYVKDTLFIGDSNTARIELYGFLGLENVIGIESMAIGAVATEKCVYFQGLSEPVTIPQAVKMMQPRRIIINFGTNNLMNDDAEGFIKDYKEALKAIRDAYKYSDIIISSVPPLSSSLNSTSKYLKQEIVDEYNLVLLKFAKENGYTFLDIAEVLKSTKGTIKDNFVIEDGIHISKAGFQAYFRYVRTHPHIADDLRPTPLKDCPTRRHAPRPVVEEEKDFDCAVVSSKALGKFVGYGFKLTQKTDDLSKATKIIYTVPVEAKSGEEDSYGTALFQFVLNQNPMTQGRVAITYSTSETAHTFTIYLLAPLEPHGSKENPHVFGQWKIIVPATCTVDGSRERVCTIGDCKEKETEIIPAGHKWEAWTETVKATCTTAGKRNHTCSVCKINAEEEILALGHTWGAWTETLKPSCTAVGKHNHTCSVCKVKVEEDIPALGHMWGEWVETLPPAVGVAGQKKRTCSVCGLEEVQEIPML
ncbi:MAG: SGNH/GDSL hydrolase family protein [Oscillospiraceae bacterium]